MNKLEKFRLKMNLETDLSERSICAYIECMKIFFKHFKIFNQDTINKFYLKFKKEYAPTYTNQMINGIKKYCLMFNHDFKLPPLVKTENPVIETITEKQLTKEVFRACDWLFDNPLKMKVVLIFLMYTGIRPKEMIKLKRENIDLNERKVYINKTKNFNARLVYFPTIVRQYLTMFFNFEAEKDNAFNISKISLQTRCIKISKESNIHITAKLLRHSFATMLVEKGFDIYTIKELLGHKNIATTMIYAQKSNRRIRKEYFEKIHNKI